MKVVAGKKSVIIHFEDKNIDELDDKDWELIDRESQKLADVCKGKLVFRTDKRRNYQVLEIVCEEKPELTD